LVCSFVLGMPSGRTNNFPESGRGLGHVIATIFGSAVGYPSDSLASCVFYLYISTAYLLAEQAVLFQLGCLSMSHSICMWPKHDL